jgi:exodeoxyribonuclease VII small subunit
MASNKQEKFNFEKSIRELNTLVEEMEQGNLSLEKSLQSFEKSIALIRKCQSALKETTQKVQILTAKDKLEPYESQAEE